jgi:hypothetical protein
LELHDLHLKTFYRVVAQLGSFNCVMEELDSPVQLSKMLLAEFLPAGC